METRNIETLLAVARRGSMAGAARQLNLTATAVALRIRALEDEFGAALIMRAGRMVRPTEAGYAVLARCEEFLREYRALRAAVTSRSIAGTLRLGAVSTVLTGLLPPILDRLSREHPELRIFLEPGTSSELYDRALAGHLDAAAIVRPSFELPKSWEFRAWRSEPLVMLLPPDETREEIDAILRDRPFICYDRQQWGGRLAAAWLETRNVDPDLRYELDALDVIAVLVGRGLGVSIVPDWSGPRPEGVALRTLSLPEPAPYREIGLLWPRTSPQMHLIRGVLDSAGALQDDAA